MGYSKLLSPHHIAAAHDWLAESGELYVHIGSGYAGPSANGYFITELGQLKALLDNHSHPSIEIYIFRDRQYPVRGIASLELLDEAFSIKNPEGWYTIISLESYPEPIYYLAADKNYSKLKREIRELEGRVVGQFVNVDAAIRQHATISVDVANLRCGGYDALKSLRRLSCGDARHESLASITGFFVADRVAERGEDNLFLYLNPSELSNLRFATSLHRSVY